MLNNGFFSIFVLAHLMGDYVLQTKKVAMMKDSSRKGLIIHIMLVCCAQTLLLAVYGWKGILAGLACGFVHFFVDLTKVLLNKRVKRLQFILLLFDQVIHTVIILVFTLIFSKGLQQTIIPQNTVIPAISIILLTYFSTVLSKILLRDFVPRLRKESFFRKYERISDAIFCTVLWAMLNISIPWGVLLAILTLYPYCFAQKRFFGYEYANGAVKYTVYLVVAMSVLSLWKMSL